MLRLGDTAPDFTLPNPVSGDSVHLADLRGCDVLVVFFRGTWCPFCREQMRVLSENYAQLQQAGIAIVGVVCQSKATVAYYLRTHPLPFPLLVDGSRQVARLYGTHYYLSHEGFNLSHPALFILDKNGMITFAHVGRSMSDLPIDKLLRQFVSFLDVEPTES